MKNTLRMIAVVSALALYASSSPGAELAILTQSNWERLAPPGKEADCILGDYALKTDRLWAVVAQPLATRNANMTVRQVGGAVIDLTVCDRPNDQLSAYYPGMRQWPYAKAEIIQAGGKKIVLACLAPAEAARPGDGFKGRPEVRLEYELEDGKTFLVVRNRFSNPFDYPLEIHLRDDMRADDFDRKVKTGATDFFWVHDHYFEQAYGLLAEKHGIMSRSDKRTSVIEYLPAGAVNSTVTLGKGQTYELTRRLFPGSHLLGIKGEARRLEGKPTVRCGWHLIDSQFKPAEGVDVTIRQGDDVYGTARSDKWGWIKADMPPEKFTVTCKSPGRATVTKEIDLTQLRAGDEWNVEYELDIASTVVGDIKDEHGKPIPCKVAFQGTKGTANPNWGPPSAGQAVVNLYYSANGQFTVPINPGSYDAVVSYGPEFDVAKVPITVEKGKPCQLKATLNRAFSTPGWVSADFHSHSSPSGDNTTDQRGRVLNLLCENIEFAPCTEHNRIDSYVPHLRALGVEKLMGTCCGIELTGSPLPLNHQNSFPLVMKPRTQDNGAPTTDEDPQKQIRRLAGWDNKSEKLVQQNHPDIGWLFFDKNGDGKPDEGYKDGFAYMNVIEVHPIHGILNMNPVFVYADASGKKMESNHTVFNWLQLLNQGRRIPGVVNTDAHYNFHGSGGLRNFVRCDASSPSDIKTLDIVKSAKKGHIILSNGPFLDVKLGNAIPGDDIQLPNGKGSLAIKVFCPNWFDIDRVQVLLNGKPDSDLNFTRKSHPQFFSARALRFEHTIDLDLRADAHVIVVALGEEKELGEVMGPMWGRQKPAAVSNPIFVNLDGKGFKPNRDTLGAPLPVKGDRPVK